MSDLERDVRDADSRSGLWFLLGIVILGSAVQMLGLPTTGSAAPYVIEQPGGDDVLDAAPVAQDHAGTDSAPAFTQAARPVERREQARGSEPGGTYSTQSPRPVTVSPQPRVAAPHNSEAAPHNAEAAPHNAEAARDAEPAQTSATPVHREKERPATRGALAPIVVLPQAHPPAARQPAPAQQPTAQDEDENEEPGTQSGSDLDSTDADRGRSVDAEPDSARIVVVGPSGVRARDFVTFTLAAENVKGLAHAPVRLAYDSAVLEFVSAEEGSFLASDGATTQFMVAPGETRGTLDIALSRMASAGGIDGSGVLATVTFLARGPGMSPIVTAGSRFLDAAARGMNLRSDDAYVSVQ